MTTGQLRFWWPSAREPMRCLLRLRGMQALVYRSTMAERIIAGVIGVLLLGLGGGLLVVGASVGPFAFIGSPISCALGLWFIVRGVSSTPELMADDAGLQVRRVFGTRFIPWEEVRAFRVEEWGKGGARVRAILHTGKKVGVASFDRWSGAYPVGVQLTRALREQTKSAQPPYRPAGPH